MNGINKAIIVGTIGNDPEIKEAKGGALKIASFSVATSDSYKTSNGEWKSITDWHNITVFNNNMVNNLKKGDIVYIEGKMKKSVYEKNGIKMTNFSIIGYTISKINFPKAKKSANENGSEGETIDEQSYERELIDIPVDIPF